jgi:hypothetical protein
MIKQQVCQEFLSIRNILYHIAAEYYLLEETLPGDAQNEVDRLYFDDGRRNAVKGINNPKKVPGSFTGGDLLQ